MKWKAQTKVEIKMTRHKPVRSGSAKEPNAKRYFQTSIPRDMAMEVKQLLSDHGYESVREFVKDAVRRRIEEFKEGEDK